MGRNKKSNARANRAVREAKLGRGTPGPEPLRAGTKVGRNAPCPCGSGEKYKRCHGRPRAVASSRPPRTMNLAALYSEEQKQADKDFRRRYGFAPNPTQLQVFMEGDEEETKRMVCEALKRLNAPEHFLHAVQQLNMLVTPLNQGMLTDEEKRQYAETLEEHRRESGQTQPASGGD